MKAFQTLLMSWMGIVICPLALLTQDLTVSVLRSNPTEIHAHRPIVFQISILNQGPEPARDIALVFTVQNTENNRYVFEKTYRINMMAGFSTQTILTNADLFYLNRSDPHMATAEVIYEFDPSPTNNTRIFAFTPRPLHFLKFAEQWIREKPFRDSTLDYGALGLQLSNEVFQISPRPMLQILCGENENLSGFVQNAAIHQSDIVWIPGSYADARIEKGTVIKNLQVSLLLLDYTQGNVKIPWYDYLEIQPLQTQLQSGGGDWNRMNLIPKPDKQPMTFINSRIPDVLLQTGHINLDLNASRMVTNPLYAGDENASGVAAATHVFKRLISKNNSILDNGITISDFQEIISRDALREMNRGVATSEFIKSQLNIIDNLQMPLKITFQENNNPDSIIQSPNRYQDHFAENVNANLTVAPDWNFLQTSLKQDAAASLLVGYYDRSGRRLGGDWICVTGTVDHPDFKGIYYVHDVLQHKEGGNRNFYSHIQTDRQNGWMRLQGLDTEFYCVWVESIVATSPDLSVQFNDVPLTCRWYDFKWPSWGDYKNAGSFEVFIPAIAKAEQGYLNIFALTANGTWYWLNRNVPLAVFNDNYFLTNPFSFQRLGFLPEQIAEKVFCIFVDYARDITYFESHQKQWNILNAIKQKVTKTEHSIKLNAADDGTHSDRRTRSDLPKPQNRTATDSVYRGCTMPNLDLDSTRHKPSNNPDVQGDWNACAPTAAANSMQWLENTLSQHIKTPLDLRQKMEELSRLMGRKDTSGVFLDTFVMGKLEFIDKYKLPIKVKFQRCCHWPIENIPSPDTSYKHSARCDNDTMKPFRPRWDWLVREMKAGEDVEMFVMYKDLKKDSVIGAHVVTITGVKKVGENRGLWYKDDGDQGKPGGTREVFVHWETDSMGFPYLAEESDSCFRTYVSGMVSESYDSTVKFDVVNTIDQTIDSKIKLNCQPNPIWEGQQPSFQILGLANQTIRYSLVRLDGQLLISGQISLNSNNTFVQIPISTMNVPGIYLLRIHYPLGRLTTKWIRI